MRVLIALFAFLGVAPAFAAYVNWLDSANYQKPAPLVVTEPTGVTNNWYVDLASGSGTACTQGSPCAWSQVTSMAGVNTGGPANIYIKGSGGLSDIAIVGGSGTEVVVRAWDDNTTATITGRNNWSANKKWLIFDGGPNMQIRFVNSGANQFDPSIYFNGTSTTHTHVTFYRTRWQVTNSGDWVSSFGGWDTLNFINSEFYATGATDTSNQHHMYLSGCTGSQTLTGLNVQNSIFYNTPGEAIELRIVNGSSFNNAVFSGNVFHDLGSGTCGASWNCRSTITFSLDSSGCTSSGSFGNNISVVNNLMWNIGENCVRAWDNPTTTKFYNNTCYQWGVGTGGSGIYGSAAFADFSFDSAVPGDFQNNLLYATGTYGGTSKSAFPGGASMGNNNACMSGTSCGTSSQVSSSGTFQSLSTSSRGFLKPMGGSSPIGHGATLSGVSPDYMGRARTAPYDIGAIQAASGSAPSVPGNPR